MDRKSVVSIGKLEVDTWLRMVCPTRTYSSPLLWVPSREGAGWVVSMVGDGCSGGVNGDGVNDGVNSI